MELLYLSPTLAFAFVGWAASVVIVNDSTQFTTIQKRLLLIFLWLLWVIPAFDAMVHRGLLNGQLAISYCGSMTLIVVLFVSITAIHQRKKS